MYPDGLVRTWRKIEIANFSGNTFAVVPRDFFRYFQLQPTLWRLEYLERVCVAAIAAKKRDPWRFETLRFQDAEQHYISTYDWPTVHHGFLVQGSVNPAAVHYADRAACLRLRRQLIEEVVGVNSEMLLMLRSAGERIWVASEPCETADDASDGILDPALVSTPGDSTGRGSSLQRRSQRL